jgi:hypothetical protein
MKAQISVDDLCDEVERRGEDVRIRGAPGRPSRRL